MTRIVAGAHGGRRLVTPPGRDTRPTSDRVREALFSTLDALTRLPGARFLDLYAGSGAVGLEAASRGAGHVLLAEASPAAAKAARLNIAALGVPVELAVTRVERLVNEPPAGGQYDVVFADPPYSLADADLARLLRDLVEQGWLAPDAVVVVERSSRSPEPAWPAGVTSARARRYGETTLWYGRRS